MRRRKKRGDVTGTATIALVLAAAVLAPAMPAAAQTPTMQVVSVHYASGQGGRVTGVILSRNGDDMVVRDETTQRLSTVTLTRDTRIESPTGFLHLDRRVQSVTSLIPGLLIQIRGTGGSRHNLVAEKIEFRRSALRVAQQISGGEVELKKRQAQMNAQMNARIDANADSISAAKVHARDSVASWADALRDALSRRMSELDSYDTRFTSTVSFAKGSAELSDEAKRALDGLVSQGTAVTGYLIEVAGYTDNTGTAADNKRVSDMRADAVVAYLTQHHNVPLFRIVNPMGFGSMRPVASNATEAGRAQNRRAEVRVLVNRAAPPPG